MAHFSCGLSISRRIRDSTHPRCRDAAQSVPVGIGEGSAVMDSAYLHFMRSFDVMSLNTGFAAPAGP